MSLSPETLVRRRLEEYAEWTNAPAPNYSSGSSIFARIQDSHENAGISGGFRPDMILVDGEAVACRPDGGLGRMAEDLGRMIARDNRCREIHDIVPYIPVFLRRVFEAAYVGIEVPRPDEEAARRLGISKSTFQKQKYGLLCWFCGVQFRSVFAVESSR